MALTTALGNGAALRGPWGAQQGLGDTGDPPTPSLPPELGARHTPGHTHWGNRPSDGDTEEVTLWEFRGEAVLLAPKQCRGLDLKDDWAGGCRGTSREGPQ